MTDRWKSVELKFCGAFSLYQFWEKGATEKDREGKTKEKVEFVELVTTDKLNLFRNRNIFISSSTTATRSGRTFDTVTMSSPSRSLSSSPKTHGYYTNGVSPTTNGFTKAHNGLEGSDTSNGWIIQKFGGTSVGKFAKTIGRDIVK